MTNRKQTDRTGQNRIIIIIIIIKKVKIIVTLSIKNTAGAQLCCTVQLRMIQAPITINKFGLDPCL